MIYMGVLYTNFHKKGVLVVGFGMYMYVVRKRTAKQEISARGTRRKR